MSYNVRKKKYVIKNELTNRHHSIVTNDSILSVCVLTM